MKGLALWLAVLVLAGCAAPGEVKIVSTPVAQLQAEFSASSALNKAEVCQLLALHVFDFDERGRLTAPERELGCVSPSPVLSCSTGLAAGNGESRDSLLECRLDAIAEALSDKRGEEHLGHIQIIFHGGLVGRHQGLEQAVVAAKTINGDCEHERVADQARCPWYYPIFIVWRSGPFDTYADHVFNIGQGERKELFARTVSGLTIASDVARGVSRTPRFGASESLRLWNTLAKPVYLGEDDPKMSCDAIRSLADDGSGMFARANIHCSSHDEDERSFLEVAVDRTVFWAGIPFRVATTPILLGPGQNAWENMRRRAHGLVWREPHTDDSLFHHDELPPLERGGIDAIINRLIPPQVRNDPDVRTSLVGHSMGAMILSEILRSHPEIRYTNVVFMGAAVSLREFIYAIEHHNVFNPRETHYYSLSLHPRNEAFELTTRGFLVPSGSLLEWIDDAYNVPPTQLDRTLGKWSNLPVLDSIVSESVARRLSFRMFGFGEGEPQKHGEFNDVDRCYWRESFWSSNDWDAHRAACGDLIGEVWGSR